MESSHRPWPVPSTPWKMTQTWHQLLFLHWRVEPDALYPRIPKSLKLDTYDGWAWLSIVAFHITGARLRLMPAVPPMSRFPELNIRTYVTCENKPGVYFFSLDAANPLAVNGAKIFYHLPYDVAKITVEKADGWVYYHSRRRGSAKEFKARYRPESSVFHAEPGSLPYWLSERYCLYTEHKQCLYRCEILHEPWPLQQAQVEIIKNTMIDIDSVSLSKPALVQYADRQKARMWELQKIVHVE